MFNRQLTAINGELTRTVLMVFYMAFNGAPTKDMEKEIICLIT